MLQPMMSLCALLCVSTLFVVSEAQYMDTHAASLQKAPVGVISRFGRFGEHESYASLGGAPVGVYQRQQYNPQPWYQAHVVPVQVYPHARPPVRHYPKPVRPPVRHYPKPVRPQPPKVVVRPPYKPVAPPPRKHACKSGKCGSKHIRSPPVKPMPPPPKKPTHPKHPPKPPHKKGDY